MQDGKKLISHNHLLTAVHGNRDLRRLFEHITSRIVKRSSIKLKPKTKSLTASNTNNRSALKRNYKPRKPKVKP